MKVQDLMTAEVITVGPDATFKEIAETLVNSKLSSVPVVDENDQVIGIVSEADLLAKEAQGEWRKRRTLEVVADLFSGRLTPWIEKAVGLTATDVMTTPVETVEPEENLHRAARRMIDDGRKRLPVVQDGRLVGIISRADVMRVFARSDGSVRVSVEGLLRRCMFVPPDYDISVSVLDGVVTLTGTVYYESDVRVAEAIVAGSDGVVDVDNLLGFREHDSRKPEHRERRGLDVRR